MYDSHNKMVVPELTPKLADEYTELEIMLLKMNCLNTSEVEKIVETQIKCGKLVNSQEEALKLRGLINSFSIS